MDIAERMRGLRLALGLSQVEVAELAQIGRTEVSMVETGCNAISSIRMRDGYAKAYGLTPSDLSEFVGGKWTVATMLKRSTRQAIENPRLRPA